MQGGFRVATGLRRIFLNWSIYIFWVLIWFSRGLGLVDGLHSGWFRVGFGWVWGFVSG